MRSAPLIKEWRRMRSLVLLSGGIDSCVVAAMAYNHYLDGIDDIPIAALTVDYGQLNQRELLAAKEIARYYSLAWYYERLHDHGKAIRHASALLSSDPELDRPGMMYVPGRNTILLALAQSLAEAKGLEEIYVGFDMMPDGTYPSPDVQPAFVEAWNLMAKYATKQGQKGFPIKVTAPLNRMWKALTIKKGLELKAPLHLTWSCYKAGSRPCGKCNACKARLAGFAEVGVKDPIGEYATDEITA